MKAMRIHQYGGPDVLKYEEIPDPKPQEGQALVDVKAIGVNFTDIYSRRGSGNPALPWIPGLEGAGVVTDIGPNVTEVTVGTRVAWSTGPNSYAEKVAVPAWRLIRIPDTMSFETAAATMLQGMTAQYLSHSTYPIRSGDTVLIHAGAGGVGLLLTQMAKRLGATVFTTVSTEAKAQLSQRAGSDHVIFYTHQDFLRVVRDTVDGRGLNAVYDSVGHTTFSKSLNCLAPRGYLVLYGHSSGPVTAFNPLDLGPKSLFLTRPSLVNYTLTRRELEERANAVLGWVQSGELRLHMHGTFPLSEAQEAHRQLEARLTTGKLLLLP